MRAGVRPLVDMEEEMRREGIPLYALESGDPVSDFDFIGFTLQYELSYTNVLNMLELAGIPLRSKDRTELHNIVVGGGPCACNPEPLADFFDIFFLGDGEEVDIEVMELYRQCKKGASPSWSFLEQVTQFQRVYVPASATSPTTGRTVKATPHPRRPATVKKRNMMDAGQVHHHPKDFVAPSRRGAQPHLRGSAGAASAVPVLPGWLLYRPIGKSIETTTASAGFCCSRLRRFCPPFPPAFSQLNQLIDTLHQWTGGRRSAFPTQLRVDNFPRADGAHQLRAESS
ncbi:MAG: hypothetical protein ACLTEG_07610 [Acutalibacter sp.]